MGDDDKEERKMFRGRGGKKPKDPNKPKQGSSSYILFCNEVRMKVKEENPGKKMSELSKIIGAKWKELKDEEKKVYTDKALVLREEYKKTQNYKDYQKILKEWNEQQMKDSDDEE